MPRLGTTELTGSSGEAYPFNVYDARTIFNDFIPVVYVISREDQAGTTNLFVGESDNVRITLDKHEKQAEFDEHGYNRISFFRDARAEVRQKAASDLIAALQPSCQ